MAVNSQILKMPDFKQRVSAERNFLDEIEKEYFEERAAIMEFDGRFTKDQAEGLAYSLVLARRERFSKAG